MVNILAQNCNYNVYSFVVDTVAELDKLPTINTRGKDNLSTVSSCAVGSRAVVTETSDRYILNGEQNKWIKDTNTGGGGGVSYITADPTDIENLFI